MPRNGPAALSGEPSASTGSVRSRMVSQQCCSNIAKLDTLDSVPPATDARRYAERMRAATSQSSDAVDIRRCASAAGSVVEVRPLGAERGGCQGLLAPLEGDRFRITIDPTPVGGWQTADQAVRSAVSARRARFIAAHELGHTLFYARRSGTRPARVFPGGSAAEEVFCDEFARALLIPPGCEGHTAAEVFDASDRFEVSLEVSARAAGAAGQDVALWRWDGRSDMRRAAIHLQWTNAAGLGAAVGYGNCVPTQRHFPN